MKKRVISLLMALCLMLALVPAVMAVDSQPDTITLPNGEVREIPTLDASVPMATSVSDLVYEDGYYIIEDETDFGSVLSNQWYANNKFRITGDLNLAGFFEEGEEWVGAIDYFLGTLEGVEADYDENDTPRYPIISGIPNNCCLIGGIIGGTIENLTFEYAGQAAFITMMPVSYGDNNYPLILRNVTTEGYVTLTSSDQSNYSPFVYVASMGGLQMYNCTNNATISGPIYGSVFHGYYPLLGSNYVFDHCVNSKNVTLNYAGMFFGNSTNLETRLSEISLTIKDCENNAEIRGLQGAKYLSAPIGGQYSAGSKMEKVESLLNSDVDVVTGAADAYPNVKEIGGTGGVCVGAVVAGFSATLTDGAITITRPEGSSTITRYVVSIGAYVNMWNINKNDFDGTDRYAVTETVLDSAFGDGQTYTSMLPVLGFADSNYGVGGTTLNANAVRYDSNGTFYYDVQNSAVHFGVYRHYVSNARTAENTPAGGASKAAQFVTVSAYNADGELVGFINLI